MFVSLNDLCTIGTSTISHALNHAPCGRRCGYHHAESADRKSRHRRHAAAQRLRPEDTRGSRLGRDGPYCLFCGRAQLLCFAVSVYGCHSGRSGWRRSRRRCRRGHADVAVSTTHDIPGFRGGNAAHVSVLQTVVDNPFGHNPPRECANMLRDVIFRAEFNLLYRALLRDPPIR